MIKPFVIASSVSFERIKYCAADYLGSDPKKLEFVKSQEDGEFIILENGRAIFLAYRVVFEKNRYRFEMRYE